MVDRPRRAKPEGGHPRAPVSAEERTPSQVRSFAVPDPSQGESVPSVSKPTREGRIREHCLRALERRIRSRHELEQMLRRKGYRPEHAAPVLDRLVEVGLIDDEAFARAWVASRQRSRPRGARALRAELREKGIDPEIVARVLEEQSEKEDPVELARRAVASRLRTQKGRSPLDIRRRAEQFLLRRGFSYEIARRALDDLLPPEEDA